MQHTNHSIFHLQHLALWCTTLILLTSSTVAAAPAEEIREWLEAHNSYRILHGVAPLTWSDTVAASAQAYAETCPSSHSGSGYGENLAWATYDMGENNVVQLWYDEEAFYDYNNPGFSSETGHFTQIVWKGTTEIGCGFATGCDHSWPYMTNVWVCQYNPPGNYFGEFAENVLPPIPNNDTGTPLPAEGNILTPLLYLLLLQ